MRKYTTVVYRAAYKEHDRTGSGNKKDETHIEKVKGLNNFFLNCCLISETSAMTAPLVTNRTWPNLLKRKLIKRENRQHDPKGRDKEKRQRSREEQDDEDEQVLEDFMQLKQKKNRLDETNQLLALAKESKELSNLETYKKMLQMATESALTQNGTSNTQASSHVEQSDDRQTTDKLHK